MNGAGARSEVVLLQVCACLRAIQLSVGLPVLLAGGLNDFRWKTLIIGSHLSAVVWAAVLFWMLFRRGKVSLPWVTLDLVLAGMWLLTVPQMCVASSCAAGWQLWVVPQAMGAIMLATIFLQLGFAAAGTLVVVCSYVTGIWNQMLHSGGMTPGLTGTLAVNVFFMIGFGFLGWMCARLLRGAARKVDLATADALEARGREATARARFDERTRQYDVLHHTVLSTLSKIARGGLDHRADEVRALCARDADFLRGLITGADDTGPGDFVSALAGVVRDKQALGLRVHSQYHALPSGVPAAGAAMLLGAAREALSNVAKHAGVDEAWLTAVGEDGGVRLTVVDRGTGFEPAEAQVGRGLMRELRHGVIESGGTVEIISTRGHGTVVEVQWKP